MGRGKPPPYTSIPASACVHCPTFSELLVSLNVFVCITRYRPVVYEQWWFCFTGLLLDDEWFVAGWYDATEVLFTIGLILLVLAILAESAFACCHCGLYKAWVPAAVGSLTLGAGTRQQCTSMDQLLYLTHIPIPFMFHEHWCYLLGVLHYLISTYHSSATRHNTQVNTPPLTPARKNGTRLIQWRRQEFSFGGLKPGHMASARSASLYGGLGAEPPAGSRGRAPGGGQGAKAPEAESFLAFGRPSDKW